MKMVKDFNFLAPAEQKAHLEKVARASLPFWKISKNAELTLLSISENATYKVMEEGREPLVLRVHRLGYNSINSIRSELAWLEALKKEAGVETPQPIAGLRGEYIQEIYSPEFFESRPVVLFSYINGSEPDDSNICASFARLGKIAARMHQHARQWPRPSYFRRLSWDYDGCIGNLPNWGKWQYAWGADESGLQTLAALSASLKERLEKYGYSHTRFGLIHSDLRLANLLVSGDETKVIDFDDCGTGWFMYDVASSVSFLEERPDLGELVNAWVKGYRQGGYLSEEDEASIATFIMLRRLTLTAWVASHKDTASFAHDQGPEYTQGTIRLAKRYLQGSLLAQQH
jgi:Ser/Thr protein kinase RdoA (MazF antagonist)